VTADPITTTEAATILGIGRNHIQKLAAAGTIRVVRRIGRVYLLDRASVESYRPGAKGWPVGKKRGAKGRNGQ
jgi:excisionase family DNA binding protein